MRTIKYKGNFTHNQVWINMMQCGTTICDKLKEISGSPIPSPLPMGVLKVDFYIYKKRASWISLNGKHIGFIYDIVKQESLSKEGKSLKDIKPYMLCFEVALPKLTYPQGSNTILHIPIEQSCYSKKELIKFLLEELVK